MYATPLLQDDDPQFFTNQTQQSEEEKSEVLELPPLKVHPKSMYEKLKTRV
jgi:hypothetical protein